MVLYSTVGMAQAIITLWGIIHMPITASWFFMIVIAVMSFELSRDLLRAAHLAGELRKSKQRMTLAAESAQIGMWERDYRRNEIWATERWRQMFGFAEREPITFQKFGERIHADDRERLQEMIRQVRERQSGYDVQYRIVLPDGTLRWIGSHGRLLASNGENPEEKILGACMDITARRLADEEMRTLSGRLIHAQEDERRRIARELHDDLNQRLALLSVELELLGRDVVDEKFGRKLAELSSHVHELSSDVHKLAYELHPAKLDQLGLVTAAGSFCRDLSAQHSVRVEFAHSDVPRNLAPDVALCAFRVLQESLHNTARHSRAVSVQVSLAVRAGGLYLTVSDDGCGFDVDQARQRGGLGLLSMQERVRPLLGSLQIRSQKGHGTQVELTLPLGIQSSP
jgi:PAS domain S-box-containing protein